MSGRISELAAALVDSGVARAFGVPGSGLSWQLITSLSDRNVPFIGTRHEGAAAIMAGASARQAGSLGCVITIKGPGLANALPGMASNRFEQCPVLSISEAFGPSTPRFRMHKRLDQFALMSPIAKACATLGEPQDSVRVLASIARAEVPGPVHLDLFAETDARIEHFAPAGGPETARLDAPHVAMLRAARRPVIIAGSLASRREWGARLASLRIPVFTTAAAKGVVDEHLPHAAGVYTGDGKALAPETIVLPEADLVIGLGLRNVEVLVPKKLTAPLLLIDAADGSTADGFGPAMTLASASDQAFETVLDELAATEWGMDLVANSVNSLRTHLLQARWLPARALAALERAVPTRTRLVTDTGSFCTVIEHLWRARSSAAFLASANGRYMGTGIPMALGVSLAEPGVPVVCVIGDGGMMYAAELKLAVERQLPIVFILMSDGRYGSIVAGASTPDLDLRAVTMARPSWLRTADGLGLQSFAARSEDEFERALASWSPSDGPMFIEATFEPESYAAMTAGIR